MLLLEPARKGPVGCLRSFLKGGRFEGVPRVPDRWLQCVSFLYATSADAARREGAGGTGAVIHVVEPVSGSRVRFLLTNAHVAERAGAVTLNRVDGSLGIVELSADLWEWGGTDDFALCPLPLEEPSTWRVSGLDWDGWAITREDVDAFGVGPGDDVAMAGRLVGYDGRERNTPVVRSGTVAMMPGEPVRDGRGLDVEAFLTDMRSFSGFSGSPTFLLINPGSWRGYDRPIDFGQGHHMLLGVDAGHTRVKAPVWQGTEQVPGMAVRENSGMAIVVPAWRITDLLHSEPLRELQAELARDPRYTPTEEEFRAP